jgi:hypothetical protein
MGTRKYTFNFAALALAAAIVGIVSLLFFGGPFYTPWGAAPSKPVQAVYLPGDGRIYTSAGELDAAQRMFKSAGREGALLYGPYVALPPGRYRATWYGTVQRPSRPRFDVTLASRGVLTELTAALAPSNTPAPLQSITFALPQATSAAELRVIVSDDDALTINRVELVALSAAPGVSHE